MTAIIIKQNCLLPAKNKNTKFYFDMQSRNISSKALVISTKPKGESNRLVTVFTPDSGIFLATLYGGPKSKLRSQVSPMNSGTIYLYKDETKNSVKISDFNVKNYHTSFRENLFKSFASSLASEILMKTHCAGNSEQSWILMNAFLDGMDFFDENEGRIGLVRFLWRYIALLGIQPDTSCCYQCGSSFSRTAKNPHFSVLNGKMAVDTLSCKNTQKSSFDFRANAFVCADCMKNQEKSARNFEIGAESIEYLENISNMTPKEARALRINDTILGETKNLCLTIIENAIGMRLTTLEAAAGIL